VHKKEGRK